MKCILSALVLFVFIFQSHAQDISQYGIADTEAPMGLKVGEEAPDFTEKTRAGGTFSLDEALENGPVALIFYRGYWCGYCNNALSDYNDSLSVLKELDIQIVAVTPESYEFVDQTVESNDLQFTVLSDIDGSIMKSYGVEFNVTEDYNSKISQYQGKSLEEINDSDTAVLPIPATYLIVKGRGSEKGSVVWRHFDPDYSKRASVNDIRNGLLSLY